MQVSSRCWKVLLYTASKFSSWFILRLKFIGIHTRVDQTNRELDMYDIPFWQTKTFCSSQRRATQAHFFICDNDTHFLVLDPEGSPSRKLAKRTGATGWPETTHWLCGTCTFTHGSDTWFAHIYTVSQKTCQQTFICIFANFWPISKILSLAHSAENLQ